MYWLEKGVNLGHGSTHAVGLQGYLDIPDFYSEILAGSDWITYQILRIILFLMGFGWFLAKTLLKKHYCHLASGQEPYPPKRKDGLMFTLTIRRETICLFQM